MVVVYSYVLYLEIPTMKKKKEQVKKNYREISPNDFGKIANELNDKNRFYEKKLTPRNGKGDSNRPKSVDYETWSNNYDAIFGKKEK